MDENSQENSRNKYSFPNSDQNIPGVSGERNQSSYIPSPQEIREAIEKQKAANQKPVVHIFDALRQEKQDEGGERRIRTYQGDIADSVKNDNVSMIKIAMSEKNRQDSRGTLDQTLETKKLSKMVLFGGIAVFVLLILIGIGIYLILSFNSQTPATNQTQQVAEPLIYTEDQVQVNVDNREREDIVRLVQRARESDIPYGNTRRVSLTAGTSTEARYITTEEFFGVTNSRVSDSLIRSLSPDFLLGIYAYSPPETFAVFKSTFYDGSFAAMLEWEQTMESDIGEMFKNKIAPKAIVKAPTPVVATTSATTTSSNSSISTTTTADFAAQNSLFFTRNKFVDKVIQNKDSRALVDEEGNVLMLYTFIDKETLVIASSDKALKEVIFRLTTGRIVR